MTYLFLGPESEAKQARMAQFKKEILTAPNSRDLDYDVLYSTKLDPVILKQSFLALPAVGSQRLILLYHCEKLSEQNKDLVLGFVSSKPDHAVLMMESAQLTDTDSFVKKIKPFVEVFDFHQGKATSVFDMTRAMSRREQPQALKLLAELLDQGIHPLQIMGGLVWFWSDSRRRVPGGKYEDGLKILQEADLNIKRSRLTPEFALELAVVKLSGLLG